ncbi:unnamed protein product [Cuscuta campestris]|uniref:FAS1 domain-containing protein n=1 Tax=Cuscuta campestris TaxID=132261 RepID=A0A484MCU8_9ASTE|nr:unnamed protein product [Cuscuta campestris]
MMAAATTTAHHIIIITPFVLLIAAITVASSSLSPSSSSAAEYHRPSRNGDVAAAMGEMQKANYFAFVMLINMAPPDLFQGNVTLLMPNDRALSRSEIMPDSNVVSFLLRHSIPSSLLFDHLRHVPTGSFIPSSKPDSMLRVTNYGRRQFFLNNSRIVNPNVCTTTAASSITCHGIDGVLQAGGPANPTPPPFPPPPRAPRVAALPWAAPSEPAPPITAKDNNNPPPPSSLTPPPADSIKINSAQRLGYPSIIMGGGRMVDMIWFVLFMFLL